MPKLKTHRGAAKRFKRTKGGKFLRSKAFKQHLLSSKTTKRRRKLPQGGDDVHVGFGFGQQVDDVPAKSLFIVHSVPYL